MTLAEFIEREVDHIVDEWEAFARTNLPAAQGLSPQELRDHAQVLLQHMAADMKTSQSGQEQHDKSRGDRAGSGPDVTGSARQHAAQRFSEGFTLPQMAAEYRALRASVVRRWSGQLAHADRDALGELIRFNEAIDQAQTESLAWYSDRLEESRNLLLGVLGHDLRNPLGAVRNSANYLLRGAEGLSGAQTKVAARILSSTMRMNQMVEDLLDFTRMRLGQRLPLVPGAMNLCEVCRDAIEELKAFHPDSLLQIHCSGEPSGRWDASRIAQIVSNLVANAIQYGDPGTPVTVTVQGGTDAATLLVHNQGPPVPAAAHRTLFEPLMRSAVQEVERREGSPGLGLGLYIARQIAVAHGGDIEVASSKEDGTTFTVRLPRKP